MPSSKPWLHFPNATALSSIEHNKAQLIARNLKHNLLAVSTHTSRGMHIGWLEFAPSAETDADAKTGM